MVERWKEYGTSGLMPGCWVVAASDYDNVSAQLAEAKDLLREAAKKLWFLGATPDARKIEEWLKAHEGT